MSTHSIIGVKTPEGFEGKYCHFDGYPTGVGYSILNAIDYFGLKDAIDVLTKKHKSGWSSIAGCDWSFTPNFKSNDDLVIPSSAAVGYVVNNGGQGCWKLMM